MLQFATIRVEESTRWATYQQLGSAINRKKQPGSVEHERELRKTGENRLLVRIGATHANRDLEKEKESAGLFTSNARFGY